MTKNVAQSLPARSASRAASRVSRLSAGSVVVVVLALGACGTTTATATTSPPTAAAPSTSTTAAPTTTTMSPLMTWDQKHARPALTRIDNAGTQVGANISAAGGSAVAATACQPLAQAIANADDVPPAPNPTVNALWQKVLGDYTVVESDCEAGSFSGMLKELTTSTKNYLALLEAMGRY